MSKDLNPDKALIFRIVHRDNLPWILENGLHCRNSKTADPNYVNIGSVELISKRHLRVVEAGPGGTLSDYVPFYFTPHTPMLLNIKTGYGGITKRSNSDIIIVASSLYRLEKLGAKFLFTDRHAYLNVAQFYSNLDDLNKIDWGILQSRDFKRDPDDPGKFERYQAEALVHRHVPTEALLGIACYNDNVASSVTRLLQEKEVNMKVIAKPGWYF